MKLYPPLPPGVVVPRLCRESHWPAQGPQQSSLNPPKLPHLLTAAEFGGLWRVLFGEWAVSSVQWPGDTLLCEWISVMPARSILEQHRTPLCWSLSNLARSIKMIKQPSIIPLPPSMKATVVLRESTIWLNYIYTCYQEFIKNDWMKEFLMNSSFYTYMFAQESVNTACMVALVTVFYAPFIFLSRYPSYQLSSLRSSTALRWYWSSYKAPTISHSWSSASRTSREPKWWVPWPPQGSVS